MNDDTIAAISTPPGEGGIGIVRLSGPQSFAIARKIIFFPREIKEPESHRLYYGYVVDPKDNSSIDEALVSLCAPGLTPGRCGELTVTAVSDRLPGL